MLNIDNAETEKQIIQELDSLQKVLHLAHHRNKNQHRASKWYKSFGQIRRQVGKLRQGLIISAHMRSISNHIDKPREGHRDEETQCEMVAQKQVVERGQFIRKYLMHKCYRSFSNLIADCQYTVLGLMLMGQLARVHSILQRLLGPEEEEIDQKENKREQKEKEDASHELDDLHEVDDSGEVISRREFQNWHALNTQAEDAAKSSSNVKINKKKRQLTKELKSSEKNLESPCSASTRKRKFRKNDIFDEMFSGLL